jgi:hypothetical protein
VLYRPQQRQSRLNLFLWIWPCHVALTLQELKHIKYARAACSLHHSTHDGDVLLLDIIPNVF